VVPSTSVIASCTTNLHSSSSQSCSRFCSIADDNYSNGHHNYNIGGIDTETDFVVSILGPANAGKSTLFNRLQCKERNRSYRLGSRHKRSRGRIASKHTSRGDAIVSPVAGTTRDRRECWGRIGNSEFRLIDTAGVDGDRIQTLSYGNNNSKKKKNKNKKILLGEYHGGGDDDDNEDELHDNEDGYVTEDEDHVVVDETKRLERAMMEQTLEAARLSDLVLLMWDARVGITHDLHETARWLRKLGKTGPGTDVVILANKLEGDSWVYDESPVMDHLIEVQRLGLGEAIPISALQGDGMADVAILIEQLKAQKFGNDDRGVENFSDSNNSRERLLSLAICGRPNVGKSTLVNTLLQKDRVITGPTPYLTRDAIATTWEWNDNIVELVDTAGIRKLTSRMDDPIEDMAVADTLRALKVAEVVVLVLDADAMHIQRQELAICNAVMEEGRALVIAANKMDLLEMSDEYGPQDFADAVRDQVESRIPMLRKIPIVPMSGLTGEGVSDLLPTVLDARNRWQRTMSTGLLNKWLQEVVQGAPPPVVAGVRAKLKYIVQTKGRPPTFILFTNTDSLPETYIRYLTKQFQDSFELFGMPVRMIVKRSSKSNPYFKPNQVKRSGFGLGGKNARIGRRKKEFQSKIQKKRRSKSEW
jgi:GTPase